MTIKSLLPLLFTCPFQTRQGTSRILRSWRVTYHCRWSHSRSKSMSRRWCRGCLWGVCGCPDSLPEHSSCHGSCSTWREEETAAGEVWPHRRSVLTCSLSQTCEDNNHNVPEEMSWGSRIWDSYYYVFIENLSWKTKRSKKSSKIKDVLY